LQAILDYLHQHYDRPLSLKELAATFKLNPDYLAHLFAQTMGLRFHDYLQELRLAKARELLLDPRQHICGVAGAVGFASAHHFRHAFKAHEGVAPSTWRTGI